MRVNRFQFGGREGGSIRMILEDGFNGIAVTIPDGDTPMMRDKFVDGGRCGGILLKLRRIVVRMIFLAAPVNDKLFSTGRTTVGSSDYRSMVSVGKLLKILGRTKRNTFVMASFRTHISFGIAAGVMGAFLLASLSMVSASWSFFVFLWLAVVVGAILPDMDSDSGVPFHVTFGSLAIIAGGLVFLAASKSMPGEYLDIFGLVMLSAGVVWGVFGALFKRFTRHRGMAHSIPAAFLSGLFVFSLAVRMSFDEWHAFLLGIAMVAGYLLHLLLDEVYAAVNFHGTPFVPNAAFGSALKLFSGSRSINIFVYGAIAFFLAGNGEHLFRLSERLLGMLG